jgi:CBS domain-containing protein
MPMRAHARPPETGIERKESGMKVQEIMTQEVITVGPETNLRDAAGILVYHRISGLPVSDTKGELVGILSEGDILAREAGVRDERRLFARLRSSKTNKKARALTVEDAMTAPAETISPHASVAEAARRMSDLGIKRLPVVKGHALVGIVSRGDLVRAFVRSDREIRHEITEDLLRRTLWLEVPEAVHVQVKRGAVRLSGQVETVTDALLLQKLVARVPGVVSVHAELGWRFEDADRARRELERLQLTAPR